MTVVARWRDAAAPVLAWLRLDLPRRWRALAVLALLIALAAGTVLTATAGARRGATALDRLAARTLPATAMVLPNTPGFDWGPVRALPEVEALTTFVVSDGFELDTTPPGGNSGFPYADPNFLQTIERPVMMAGRRLDPTVADEVMVTPGFQELYGKGIGDTVDAHLPTPAQVTAAVNGDDPGPPAGPIVPLRIVGIGRTPWGAYAPPVGLVTGAGFYQKYHANLLDPAHGYLNALVRLRGGEADLPRFRADLARVSGRADIDSKNFAANFRQFDRTASFEASCLLAFAGAALIAALLLIGQAVGRYTEASVQDLRTLRALGMTSPQATAAAAVGPALAAVAGSVVAVLAAIVGSRWFPIGTAATMEPTPGVTLDGLVLGAGLIGVPVLVLAGSAGYGWLATRFESSASPAGSGRGSAVAAAALRLGAPVPITFGTRLALERGRGRTAVPVRPALIGAVVGVLGVLAAFTFSAAVAEAAGNPARFGQTFQIGAFLGLNNQDMGRPTAVLRAAAAVPDVAGANDGRMDVADAADGKTTVPLYSYTPVGHPLPVVISAGRLPVTASEVVLAPTVAAALGATVGSSLPLTGFLPGSRSMTVTGLGFVPEGPHNSYADGGWVSTAGYDALFGAHFKFHFGQLALRPGADVAGVLPQVRAAVERVQQGSAGQFGPPDPPLPIAATILQQVQRLPLALGVFLVVLAVGAVGHALATAVRRRRHDLAVLRALGMTRGQTRAVVITQATVLALVGLIFGVPLGLALGRTVWRLVADFTPLQYAPPLAFWALVLIGPLALLASNLLAALPGRQATRQQVGQVLRTE